MKSRRIKYVFNKYVFFNSNQDTFCDVRYKNVSIVEIKYLAYETGTQNDMRLY